MVSMFDQLPLEAQNNLLTYRWDKDRLALACFRSFVATRRRTATTQEECGKSMHIVRSNSARAPCNTGTNWIQRERALRLFERLPVLALDSVRGRFGILPDETLPEVDFALPSISRRAVILRAYPISRH